MKTFLLLLLLPVYAFAIENLNWNNIPVLYIEDERIPQFQVSIYFGQGAQADIPSKTFGATEAMFQQILSGTKSKVHQQIVSELDFMASEYSSIVTHEYSIITMKGLMKYASPTAKLFCELLSSSTYPKRELESYINRLNSRLTNLSSSHQALAERVFRQLTLKDSPYAKPMDGTLDSLPLIKSEMLVKLLAKFRDQVPKKIFIFGPKKILDIQSIVINDCQLFPGTMINHPKVAQTDKKQNVYFLPVKEANQAQVRVGRILGFDEVQDPKEVQKLSSYYLGGGFTSKLVQELRVKKGLTYSVSAYVSPQKNYGRLGISTFTKNETILETLDTIAATLANTTANISAEELKHTQNYVLGSYPFSLESNSSYLQELINIFHLGKSFEDFKQFPARIKKITVEDVKDTLKNVWDWNSMQILVVGDISVKKDLEKKYKVTELRSEDFL